MIQDEWIADESDTGAVAGDRVAEAGSRRRRCFSQPTEKETI